MFVAALVALMAGALFYAARIPVEHATAISDAQQSEVKPQAQFANSEQSAAEGFVTHPTFTLPDIDGIERHSSQWHGKSVILNFWATWCGPCRKEIPLLKAFQDEHGKDGFQVIGIAVDFADAVAEYAVAAEFNYPILVGEQDAMAIPEASGIGIPGLPLTMFVSAEGELLSAFIGELHQSHLDQIADIMTRLDLAKITAEDARTALNGI